MQIRGESAAILRPGSDSELRGWVAPRSGEEASVRLARKGEEKGEEEEEESLHRWMVGTIVMMVMMLPSRA